MASSVDGTVQRFDIRGGCLYADALGSPVSSIALSHDQNCILAACLDNCVRPAGQGNGGAARPVLGRGTRAALLILLAVHWQESETT